MPSAVKQKFNWNDYEIIVIDDASEEEYPLFNKLKSPNRVRYYKNETRKGLAYNRNKGVEMANGEYIVSLDDDNEFHPNFLEETVRFLDKYPEFDAVGVGKNIIYPEGKVYQLPKLPCSINDGFLIRKKVFEKIKFDENLQANEDADFGIQFFKVGFKMGLIDEPFMTVYASAIINRTSYSDYSDYHLDGLAKFWLKNHDYKQYIGRMFLLSAGRPKWFKPIYWLEEKLKRYWMISDLKYIAKFTKKDWLYIFTGYKK